MNLEKISMIVQILIKYKFCKSKNVLLLHKQKILILF